MGTRIDSSTHDLASSKGRTHMGMRALGGRRMHVPTTEQPICDRNWDLDCARNSAMDLGADTSPIPHLAPQARIRFSLKCPEVVLRPTYARVVHRRSPPKDQIPLHPPPMELPSIAPSHV